jgi:glycosyltransferase involved in cell wall biosynthesis
MWMLAQQLGGTIHEPSDDDRVVLGDRLRAKLLPSRSLWSLARRVCEETGPGDVIFCSSEAGGLQLAAVAGASRQRARLAVFVHNLDRPRGRLALRVWRMANTVDLFLACSNRQVEFLRQYLRLEPERVRHVWDHTDTRFFTPGPPSPDKARPTIVSVGLERRDYRTLAAATQDLPVDVRISGFSKDASAMRETFPDPLPANMTRGFYSWRDLVQLYRDADVVVVSCRPNPYAAGVQSLMEAMACRRPVIATATEGLRDYLDDRVRLVNPGDAAGMRTAILEALQNNDESESRARRGHDLAVRRYDIEAYVRDVTALLKAMA